MTERRDRDVRLITGPCVTPLVYAAEYGDVDTVRWHIERGSDLNQVKVRSQKNSDIRIGNKTSSLQDIQSKLTVQWSCVQQRNCLDKMLRKLFCGFSWRGDTQRRRWRRCTVTPTFCSCSSTAEPTSSLPSTSECGDL